MGEAKEVIECVDEVIKNVCETINKRDIPDYADTVKALAELVTARAYHRTAFRCFESSRPNPHREVNSALQNSEKFAEELNNAVSDAIENL